MNNDKDTASEWFAREYKGRHVPGVTRWEHVVRDIASELLAHHRERNPEAALPHRAADVLDMVRRLDHGQGVSRVYLCDVVMAVLGLGCESGVRHHLTRLQERGMVRTTTDERGRVYVHAIRP